MNAYNKNPDIFEVRKYFNFYQNKLLPQIEIYSIQAPDGCHALHTHTAAVVFRGIDYALSLDENPIPVIFAGAFHDMARANDDIDEDHGARAVPNAHKIMQIPKFKKILSDTDVKNIIYAIMNHTNGRIASDYVSKCLWDADRTRMSWVYGFKAKYFNTDRAKYVASHSYIDYIKFQQQCIPQIFWSYEY